MYKFPVEIINSTQNQIIGISKVKYGNNLLTKWFVKISEKILDIPFSTIGEKLIKKMFTFKGKDWKYEKEIRILRICAGPLEIDRDFLAQICFGLDTTKRDRDLVRKVVNDSGYNISFCEIVRSDSDFGLTVKDL